MDLLRLNDTTRLPEDLIEGYSSLIWTERYLDPGEFELTTPLVDETRTLLPEGCLVTLRDTREVMITESHSIQVGDDRSAILKVTGRTLESFAENRAIRGFVATEKNEWETVQNFTTSNLVTTLLRDYLVATNPPEHAHPSLTPELRDRIPGLAVTNSTTSTQTAKKWWVDPGPLYDAIRDFLGLAELGIRTLRPLNASESLTIDIFNGKDTGIVFRYDAGHIEDPSYLFSIKGIKNVAHVRSDTMVIDVWPKTGRIPPNPEPTGFARRVLFIDGGSQGDLTTEEFEALLVQKAQIELMKHNRAAIFDGAISPLATHIYGVDYGLGDKVTLAAQYGFQETMLVAEHVRTEDQAGEQAYPTLILAETFGEGL